MVYIFGMSHAISVVRALNPASSFSHHSWAHASSSPGFTALEVQSGLEPLNTVWVHLIPPKTDSRAIFQDTAGQRTVAASPAFLSALDAIDESSSEHSVLFSFLGGNEHAQFSILAHPSPYDFVWPRQSTAPLVAGHQPIATSIIETGLRNALHQTFAQLAALRARRPKLRVIHVLPPPPHGNESTMRASPEVFGELMITQGLMPLSIRLKYYGLYCEILRTSLASVDVACLEPPTACTRPDGALADEYTLGCTHGNEAYGALVASQMRELL